MWEFNDNWHFEKRKIYVMRKYGQIQFLINYEILSYMETTCDMIILDKGKLFSSKIYVELIKSYVDGIFMR